MGPTNEANLVAAFPQDVDGSCKYIGILSRLGQAAYRVTTPGSLGAQGRFARKTGHVSATTGAVA